LLKNIFCPMNGPKSFSGLFDFLEKRFVSFHEITHLMP